MKAAITLLLVSIGLSGCISLDDITPSDTPAKDTSFYRVDTKFRFLCLGESTNCRDMSKIVSARSKLKPIESEYNTEIKGPNYPVSLMRTIMYPNDKKYTAKPLGTDGRHFSLPITPRTKVVWTTLEEIEATHYAGGS